MRVAPVVVAVATCVATACGIMSGASSSTGSFVHVVPPPVVELVVVVVVVVVAVVVVAAALHVLHVAVACFALCWTGVVILFSVVWLLVLPSQQ